MLLYQIIRYSFISLIFTLLLSISISISGKSVFTKANVEGNGFRIPIYNLYLLLNITNLPLYNLVMLFIPIVNIYAIYKLMSNLVSAFNASNNIKLNLFLFPVVYLPLLGSDEFTYKIDEDENIVDEMTILYTNEKTDNLKDNEELSNTTEDDYFVNEVDSIYKGKFELEEEAVTYKAKRVKNVNKYYDEDEDDN